MKILKTIMLGTAMVALFGIANAAKLTGDVPFTSDYVLKTYTAAVTQGNLKGFEKILDNHVIFTTTRNDQVIEIKYEDFLNNLKANEGIKQDCTATSKLVGQTIENSVYELDIKYADYTSVNIITMVGADDTGWKITNVNTTIK